jgi:hypothetical protein
VDFFNNPNIGTTIVEQVPCAFAKTRTGEFGTHFVVVMLDKRNNLMYISCQCEENHGEDISSTMHEMGGDTCFDFVGKIRDQLVGKEVDWKSETSEGSIINNALLRVSDQIRTKRYKRKVRTSPPVIGGYAWAKCLTNIAQTLAKTPLVRVAWNDAFTDESHVLNNKHNGYFVFSLNYTTVARQSVTDGNMGGWLLQGPFAHGGQPQPLTQAGKLNLRVQTYQANSTWSHTSVSNSTCAICHKSFTRISKHTQGDVHRNQIVEKLHRALKFTQGAGLKAVLRKGVDFYTPRGRNTTGKMSREAQRIEAFYSDDRMPTVKDWKLWSGPLGFKNIAVDRYVERHGLTREDATKVFEMIEGNPLDYPAWVK